MNKLCVLCYAEKDTEPYQDRKFYYFDEEMKIDGKMIAPEDRIICDSCIKTTKEEANAEWTITKEVYD